MERIYARHRATKNVVRNIARSLTASLQGLSLQDTNDPTLYYSSSSSGSSSSSSYKAYRHGSAATAIHSCLADLFNPPYMSMVLTAIDGYERIYCNDAFERIFITTMECNRRLLTQGQSPTYHIMGRLVVVVVVVVVVGVVVVIIVHT